MDACTSQILDMIISDVEAHSRECELRIAALRRVSEALGSVNVSIIGDRLAHDSPRQLRERARKLVDDALGNKP